MDQDHRTFQADNQLSVDIRMNTEESEKPITEERQKKAGIYLNQHLEDQLGWYDIKASKFKKWHKHLGFIIIAAGALSTLVPLWKPDPALHWTTVLTALLGVVVVLAKGIERIWAFDENWLNYRQAAEVMKREQRLYINGAGVYAECSNESEAYRLFVERVEDVIAAEQHSFWQNNRGVKEQPTNDNGS
jgi:hypothetical protein